MAATLPPEILLLILDALAETSDRFGLLKVCRNWNTALVSKVYSSVKVTFFPEVYIVPFAQAIHKNTRLRSTVRELILPNFYADSYGASHYNASLFRGFLESFTDSAEELKRWEELLDVRETTAWLAVVLLLLKISNTSTYTGANSAPSLQSGRADGIHEYPVCDFAPFFKLPAMRALHLSGVHEAHVERFEKYRDFWIPLSLEPGCSPVREIIVNNSNCKHGMAEFIASCANLERFEYQHRNQALYERTYLSYRCHPFHTALLTQKQSLQVLRLNDIGIAKWVLFEEADNPEARRHAWFGSLAEFTALRELRMPVRNLLQSTEGQEPNQSLVEILPPSIEYLCLAKTDMIEYTMLESQLRRLLDVRGQQFPNLQKIVLQLFQMEVFPGEEEVRLKQKNWGVPPRAKEAFADIMSICKQEGVEFSFVNDEDYQILVDGKVMYDTTDCYTTAQKIRWAMRI
ncbi:hypothetical protein C8Q69DRAFT_448693 [Paecilomyces variotii]|uniref:Uncharacterized protein n=1 Tax=Byssochlamys spectabilis TaxID=264951 RepID=A0A443HHP5_BYSSP|nr:hypothetical protein C8Q69DRAFT_448693 [Paecilomyces variotii]KAJ9202662.1 hypothetical protein DTO032I3_3478 [Paecilomyces variotii]KAJ9276860.1 hypothetical protein DTO021D3_6297 [Paecilomyces variotii]KAJ9340883.1 hypothetical protein DTO027B6_6570 [Paecilomyces variotii]KAJ9358455.1 hypothetical protein DTO280E4_5214 [Paecilomyces variotii]KAJ9380734.1 hypothetical protein DTO032I4_6555 [Paecilomyces variotii]